MAVQKYIAGAQAAYTAAFGTEVNSVVNGNAVLSSIDIDNSSALDTLMDISISLGSVAAGAGSVNIAFYLYPKNEDNSTYGDGQFGTSAAGPPPASYLVGIIPVVPSVTAVIVGTLRQIELPPGHFKLVVMNNAGVTLASSANVIDYKTYNLSVA